MEWEIFSPLSDSGAASKMKKETDRHPGCRRRKRKVDEGMEKKFVKVEGTEFVKDGKPMLFRGLGIGTWLNMEHFMLGFPTPDNQIRKTVRKKFGEETAEQFFDTFIRSFAAEEDFALMKECGVNVVRVPFNYRLFIDDQNPDVFKEEGMRYFNYLLDLCDKYQIYLLADLHTTPGGQNPDWHADNNTGIPQFWHYKVFRDQVVRLWKHIAEACEQREYLLGYDVINEPYLIDAPDVLTDFYKDVTEAIREVDQNHIIFLEGDHFAMQFDCIHAIYDENTALTFHYYPTVWEPELFDSGYDKEMRLAKFRSVLEKVAGIREQFHRPILCGEAGYDIDKENVEHSLELLEETLDIFNEANVSWTIWCYKDAQFMGMVYPKAETPWMQFVEKIHEKWTHYGEMKQANDLMDTIRALPEFAAASEELCYFMQFRQRGILYRFQTECILEPLLETYTKEQWLELPKSFRLENCSYYEGYAALLKEKTKA